MENIELARKSIEDGMLYADELWYKILETVGCSSKIISIDGNNREKYDCGVSLYPINKFELLCFLFGTVTSEEVLDMGIPYQDEQFYFDKAEYDNVRKRKRAILYNQLSTRVSKGMVEIKSIYSANSKNTENGSRNLYGLTKMGNDKIQELALKMGIENRFGERKISRHEYAVSLSLLSLIRHNMDIKFETEIVKNLGDDLIKSNKEDSIRADAQIEYNKEIFYLEQDMFTETNYKIINKLRFYRQNKNKLIFTFHKMEKTSLVSKKDLKLIEELADNGYITTDIIKMARCGDLSISKDGLRVLETAFMLNPSEDCKSGIIPYITYLGKDKISKALKLKKMLDTVEIKTFNLFYDILNSEEISALLSNGMNVFTSASETLYKSVAFSYDKTTAFILKNVAVKEDYINIAMDPVHVHGVFFKSRIKFRDYNMYLEYVQEDIGGLVRMYKSYNSIENSSDKLIMVYNTDSFREKLIELVTRKKKTFKNLILVNRFTLEKYKITDGQAVTMGE